VRLVVLQTMPAEVVRTRYSEAMRDALAARYRMTSGFVIGFPYGVFEAR